MGLRKQSIKLLNYLLIISFLATSLSSVSFTNISSERFSISNELNTNYISNLEENTNLALPNPYQDSVLQYTPINSTSETGDSFTVNDELSVTHDVALSLNSGNSWENSFTIQPPTGGFTPDYLQYGLTLTATQDTYLVHEGLENKHAVLNSDHIRLAQAFQISWDYGVFYSAEINLETNGPTLGSDEIELYIVKEDGFGDPNLGDIRAYEVNGPYNSSNPIPGTSYNNYGVYYFQNTTLNGEAILEQGTYFVVIELTVVDDSNAEYDWLGKQGITSGYPYYVHDGFSWSYINDETRGLLVDLKPSYSNGTAMSFDDPSDISLVDNAIAITSLTQQIMGSGVHTLSSDTSVDIVMSNSYSFDRTILANSQYSVTNSTHLANTVDWTLTWSIGTLNLFTYTNPIRTQEIITPSDWHNTIFDLMVNDSTSIPGVKSSLGYDFNLNTILNGSKYDSGDFEFTTSSPNYLYDLNLNSLDFDLGYWETDDVNATGFNGSTVIADVYVKDSLMSDVLTGDLNFTLYDPDGQIVPVKNDSLYPNLIFNDVSTYTLLETTQDGAGHYNLITVFDPSFEGTDKEGFWTAVCVWQNGTEIGYYSLRISVSKSTTANFSWEVTEGGSWSSNSSTSLTRINEESIRVLIEYNNISDPFFSGDGTPITAAPVSFTTSWGSSGLLTYNGSYYEGYINLNAEEGLQSIDLIATGNFLQEHFEIIDIYVLHAFDIQALPDTSFEAYYEDDFSDITFRVRDLKNASVPVIPDEMFFYLDDVLLTQFDDYDTTIESDRINLNLSINSSNLNLSSGYYTIKIEVTKSDFVVDYGVETATQEVDLEIKTVTTELQLLAADEAVYQNSVTTIKFLYVDTIHNINITGASVSVTFDITEASLVDIYEVDGLYTVTVRVLEPQETSIHIHISVSKAGYNPIVDYPSPEVAINIPGAPKGIPLYLYIIIGVFGLATILIPTILLIRRKLTKEKRMEKALFSRIYGLYESVLSITKLIAVHKITGLPVYEMDLGSEISLDPSLITGFLSAISSMGVELRGDRAGSVKRLQYKNFFVTGSDSGQFTIYTFSEIELNEEIEEKLTVVSDWFAKMFNQINENWDGSTEVFRINLQGITEKIMKEINLWIFYPFIISPYKTAEIETFTGLRKTLAEYIVSHDNVTISRIFEDLDDIKIEKGLPVIFEFVETGIITPVFDAYKIATVRF